MSIRENIEHISSATLCASCRANASTLGPDPLIATPEHCGMRRTSSRIASPPGKRRARNG